MGLMLCNLPKPCMSSSASSPALFIFGDSIADSGNNNHLATLAKVDYYPYGIDFPGGVASGRFSNGYNALDYMAFNLGLPLIPFFAEPSTKGHRLLQGVNFASGGSGIQAYTGRFYGELIPMDDQIRNFQLVKQQIVEIIGAAQTDDLLANSAYYVVTGSNDWLQSYYFLLSPLRVLHTPAQYRDLLIDKLISQVEAIYNIGARKVGVAGLPPLGCCPSQLLEYRSNGSCIKFLNDVSADFNDHLISKLLALNDKLPNASIVYNNIYTPIIDAVENPYAFNFKIANHACCGIGKYGGFLTCLRGLKPCENVEDHMYWDAYHPTDKFYPQLVKLIWEKGAPYSIPISLKELFTDS